MKVYVAFDMEGCSGTAFRGQMSPNPETPQAYPRAMRFATDDVKAAVDGILEVDPNAEIWFNDAHGKNMNVLFEEFPKNVLAVVGSGESMDEVMGLDDSFDALMCIGAHGNPLTADAVLCHVWGVRDVRFNGKSLSETGLDASLAGYYGVPLVALSGDEASMNAMRLEISPKVATAIVKKGIGMYSAVCINPREAQRLIKEAVIDGLKRRREIRPLAYSNPITVEITYKDHYGAYANKLFMPKDERVSATQIRFIAENAKEAYNGFFARYKLSKPIFNMR